MKTGNVSQSLREWIHTHTGVVITDANAVPVDLALHLVADDLGLEVSDYSARLRTGNVDPQPFIDAVTTHESYFFRAFAQMEMLVKRVIPELLSRNPNQRVRVLSLPCARGEEPFSLIILLYQHGIDPGRVMITGADIALRCLEDARRGIYSELALRRVDRATRQRWFRSIGKGSVRIDPRIPPRVELRRVNLLTEAASVLEPGFDIIFCENLLIYFGDREVDRSLAILQRLLAPRGWLFVDHAEWNLPRRRFDLQQVNGVYGFRPKPARSSETAARPRSATGVVARGSAPPVPPIPSGPAKPSAPPVKLAGEPAMRSESRDPLRSAQELYQQKRFTEAMGLYDELLASDPAIRARVQLGKARVLADCGEELEALEYAEAALQIDGTRALPRGERVEALALIAAVMRAKGLTALVENYLSRIRDLDPDHPVLRLSSRRDTGHA